jgi:hypothetical protein
MQPQNGGGREQLVECHRTAPLLPLEETDLFLPPFLSVTRRWQQSTLNIVPSAPINKVQFLTS